MITQLIMIASMPLCSSRTHWTQATNVFVWMTRKSQFAYNLILGHTRTKAFHLHTIKCKYLYMFYLQSSSLVIFCVNPGSKRQLINEDLGSLGKQNWSLNRTAKWSEFTDPFEFMAYITDKKFLNAVIMYLLSMQLRYFLLCTKN